MKKLIAFLIGASLGSFSPLLGQAGLGSITGTVVDPSGAVIPGAGVQMKDASTQGVRTISSNEVGLFTLPSITPGRYSVTITAAGFKEKKLDNITVNAFQQISLGLLSLEIGSGAASVVTVTAEQQLIKESAVRYDTVQAKMVEDMPLFGRNWTGLLKAIPGANPTASQGFNGREYGYYGYADFPINGKDYRQTAVNLDGGGIVDHGSDGKTTVAPSLESIQEVSLLTNNFQAEYGTRAGVVVNVITKSGTNRFRGTAWDYLRNEALNANSWQNNYHRGEALALPLQLLRRQPRRADQEEQALLLLQLRVFQAEHARRDKLLRVPSPKEQTGDFSETIAANGQRPLSTSPAPSSSGKPQSVPRITSFPRR